MIFVFVCTLPLTKYLTDNNASSQPMTMCTKTWLCRDDIIWDVMICQSHQVKVHLAYSIQLNSDFAVSLKNEVEYWAKISYHNFSISNRCGFWQNCRDVCDTNEYDEASFTPSVLCFDFVYLFHIIIYKNTLDNSTQL